MADRDIDLFDCSVAILDGNMLLYNGQELDVGTAVTAYWRKNTGGGEGHFHCGWAALHLISPGPHWRDDAEFPEGRFTLGTYQMDETVEEKRPDIYEPEAIAASRERMAHKAERGLADKLKAIHQEMRDGGAESVWSIWRQRLFIGRSDNPSEGLFGMAALCDVSLLGVRHNGGNS